MVKHRVSSSLVTVVIWFWSWSVSVSVNGYVHNDFLECLSEGGLGDNTGIAQVVYTPNNSSYSTILIDSIRNLRFTDAAEPKPQVIVTPVEESQIPLIVVCAKANGLQIRTRSGGHDYEGMSSISRSGPFIIVDLFRMSNVTVDPETQTAWVQTGATNGQMYYSIYNTDRRLGFPAGGCPTVGVGGLFSGGGYGSLLRKYGLAGDNIIDARFVDANGQVLDRESMGEDLFWAIRGGGGGSFGIVTAYRIHLVSMPDYVTVFLVQRTVEQNCTDLIHRWQYVAPFLPRELFVAATIQVEIIDGKKTVRVSFTAVYLGGIDPVLELMSDRFPELNLTREECQEVRWIQSSLLFGGYPVNQSVNILTDRNPADLGVITAMRMSFKAKLDFIRKPMPKSAFRGMWKLLLKREVGMGQLLLVPHGGKMAEYSESALPYPHRTGVLYQMQQLAYWNHTGVSDSSLKWVRNLYDYLTPFVSKNPREAYINYRDNDLGVNDEQGNTSYAKASVWGIKYFKGNFRRLAEIKTKVDPGNYFRHEQSIPILNSKIDIIIGGRGEESSTTTAAIM